MSKTKGLSVLKKVKGLLFACAVGIGMAATPALSADTEITVSTWGGPNHPVNSKLWPILSSWIEKATDDRVTLKVVHDLGPPAAQMDLVNDGVADMAWIFHGHMPGRFALTQISEIPASSADSETISAAYWNLHEKYLAKANEHRGLRVLGIGVHGPGQIFTNAKADDLASLKSKRLRVGGGVMSEVVDRLGVVGAALPPNQLYEAASQGVIDGALQPFDGVQAFRLGEVTHYGLINPAGFYRGSFAIIMNPDKWDEISPEDQKAIEGVTGEKLSRLFGAVMDGSDKAGMEYFAANGGKNTELSAEDQETLKKIFTELRGKWETAASDAGIDAKAAVSAFDADIEAAKNGSRVTVAAAE